MGAQSRTLQQHWRRGITMGDTVRLLSDINSIVDTPQKLQKLEEAKASPSWHVKGLSEDKPSGHTCTPSPEELCVDIIMETLHRDRNRDALPLAGTLLFDL